MTREEFQTLIRERLIAHAVNRDGMEDDPELPATLDISADVALFLHEDYAVAWRVLDKFMTDTESSGHYLLTIARLYRNLDERREFVKAAKSQFMVLGMDEKNARLQSIAIMNQIEMTNGTLEGFEVRAVNMETGEEIVPPRSRMN